VSTVGLWSHLAARWRTRVDESTYPDLGVPPAAGEHVCVCGVRIYRHLPSGLAGGSMDHYCRLCGTSVDGHPLDGDHVCAACGEHVDRHVDADAGSWAVDRPVAGPGHVCGCCGVAAGSHDGDLRAYPPDCVLIVDGRPWVRLTDDDYRWISWCVASLTASAVVAGVVIRVVWF
jgi:hypothetical protein